MNSLIYLTTALLVFTKLLDVLSTLGRITHPRIETNPLARSVMQKIGVKAASWLMKNHKDIRDEINENSAFALELDRRRGNRYICYDVGSEDFPKFLRSTDMSL